MRCANIYLAVGDDTERIKLYPGNQYLPLETGHCHSLLFMADALVIMINFTFYKLHGPVNTALMTDIIHIIHFTMLTDRLFEAGHCQS